MPQDGPPIFQTPFGQQQQTWPPPGQGGGGFTTVNRGTETPPNTPWPPTGPPPETPPTTGGGGGPLPNIDIVDDCMRSVSVGNIAGFVASVEVFVNGVSKGKVSLSGQGVNSVKVPINGCLKIGDVITATVNNISPYSGTLTPITSNPVTVESHEKYNVTTQHYNNARTGWFQYETQLTPNNIANIKERARFVVEQVPDSQNPQISRNMIYAQPLYLHNQFFPRVGHNGEVHNAVYIATENNSVYAFDADLQGTIDFNTNLWARSSATKIKNSLLPPGLTAVDDYDAIPQSDIKPPIGISSTPVIDCGCNCDCENCGCGSQGNGNTPTIYIVSKSQRGIGASATFHFYLHALDVTTGDDRPNSPMEITGQVDGVDYLMDGSIGSGPVIFNSQKQNCRPGLLLVNCTVYIAFAAHEDTDVYHGWVFSYDAKTLKQQNIYCTTPQAVDGVKSRGGIWQSGMGLATDGCSIYCTTGNGAFDQDKKDFGCSVLKLSQDLRVLSWFSPSNNDVLNGDLDVDLGSGGVLLLPQQRGSSIPLLVTAGKDGQIFLLNSNNLGGFDNSGSYGNSPNSVQTFFIRLNEHISDNSAPGAADAQNLANPGLWGSPAYFNGSLGPIIFYCMNGTTHGATTNVNTTPELVGISLQNNKLSVLPQLKNNVDTFPGGGSIPVVSSNQSSSGIVWLVRRLNNPDSYPSEPNPLTLQAYDANDFTKNFPASPQLLKDPTIQYGTCPGLAFIEPTVINGKVYVPSDGHVSVFF